jgi:hypothetical protein
MKMTDKFQDILDSFPTKVYLAGAHCNYGEAPDGDEIDVPDKVVVCLNFSEVGYGFGGITILQNKNGIFINTECTNMERVKKYFMTLLDQAITDLDRDPERHARYCEAMDSSCGPACRVCFP